MAVEGSMGALVRGLAEAGRSSSLERGEVLFRQGARASEIFLVHEGRLHLERNLESGIAVTISVVRAPAILAEASLCADHYHCRATAETSCVISRVAKSKVMQLLADEPDFSLTFVRALAVEVRELRARLELRNVRPVSERLLQYLRMRQEQGLPPYDRPLAGMASELGVTPEALYRVASRLESAGKIRRRGGRLLLTD